MNIFADLLFFTFSSMTIYVTFLFLIVFFENRNKMHDAPETGKLPFVSIVTPAYNEERTIAKTIENIKNLIYPKHLLEIIVVDDGSTDNTLAVVRKIRGIKVMTKKNSGKANSLNTALSVAKGKIFGCIDSDSFPKSDALLKAVSYFNDPAVAGVTSSIFVHEPKKILERLQQMEYIMILWCRKLLDFLGCVHVTPGPLSLYRKDVLLKVGGFDERSMTEDIEIACRLLANKYKVRMSFDSITSTKVPSTLKSWWHQRLRWNIGGIQTILKYRYTIFNKKFDNLGMFILPISSLSFAISFLAFVYVLYILGKSLFVTLSIITQSLLLGGSVLFNFGILFIPDIITFFSLVIFLTSLVLVKYSLNVTKGRLHDNIALNSIYVLLYLSIYLFLFPPNVVHSLFKFAFKRYTW